MEGGISLLEQYNDILTVTELSEILRIGTTHAYKLLRSKKINAFKEGKDWKISKDEPKNYIISNSQKTLQNKDRAK